MQAVAAHLGVSKADLLDPEAPDMAVRQALGETQVIAATKAALGDAGQSPANKDSRCSVQCGRATTQRVCYCPSVHLFP